MSYYYHTKCIIIEWYQVGYFCNEFCDWTFLDIFIQHGSISETGTEGMRCLSHWHTQCLLSTIRCHENNCYPSKGILILVFWFLINHKHL